jgi:hypothetical protein
MKRLLLVLGLSGCAVQPTQQALQIRQTRDLTEVKGCDYIAPVKGGGAMITEINGHLRMAQAQALNAAAAIHASHVVWQDAPQQAGLVYVSGDAYRCP